MVKINIKDKLHIGCGLNFQEDWINLDGSWNAWFAKYSYLRKLLRIFRLAPNLDVEWSPDIIIHKVLRPLPFPNNSMRVVYTSHLLEHLYLDEARALLRECWRVLKFGGVLRIMVPDLENMASQYVNDIKNKNENVALLADLFIKSLGFRDTHSPRGGIIYRIYSSLKDFHTHKWMYDKNSLAYYMEQAGFQDVKKMQRYKSRIENIEKIEQNNGLCVEGIKRI
ncbi:methyltransferase domain-containing protein [Candidatus Wolfebacteria bacterium]|nr:methyltransferase domain-containing protein [Candidatus Wolfebacteria bacterium]